MDAIRMPMSRSVLHERRSSMETGSFDCCSGPGRRSAGCCREYTRAEGPYLTGVYLHPLTLQAVVPILKETKCCDVRIESVLLDVNVKEKQRVSW